MTQIILSYLLYAIVIALIVYIIRSIIRNKVFTVADALAVLGIIVAIVLSLKSNPPVFDSATPKISLIATFTPTPTNQVIPTPANQVTSTPLNQTLPTSSINNSTITDNFDFDLVEKAQFPETELVRIFLYVRSTQKPEFDGLGGYTLHVTKDGVDMPIKETSSAGSPGFTWPVADVRQRFQNLKVEYPGIDPNGIWVLQLSKDGIAVGPPASFRLKANDPNQELYIRYNRP